MIIFQNKTEIFIELLKNNNMEELDKYYQNDNCYDEIEFDKVYQEINELSNASIYNILGYMYMHGKGVSQNYDKAMEYLSLSLDKDDDILEKIVRKNLKSIISKWNGFSNYIMNLVYDNEKKQKKIEKLEKEYNDLTYNLLYSTSKKFNKEFDE